jgi:hypothetical protein
MCADGLSIMSHLRGYLWRSVLSHDFANGLSAGIWVPLDPEDKCHIVHGLSAPRS